MFVYFSEYDIRMFLLVLWLRNLFFGRHTCATGGIEKGSSKMCTGVQMGRGSENRSYDTYILNGWPQTNVVEYFLCIYSAKYTRTSLPARKMSLFSSIIITNILSYAIIRIQFSFSFFYIRISTKKQALDFLKRIFCIIVCLKFFCDKKLVTPLLFFNFQ